MGGKSGGGGGGKGKGGAPKPPDFGMAAEMTSQSSRPNIANPMGSQTWTKDAQGRDVSTIGFTGQNADTFNGLLGGMNKAAGMDPTQAGNQAFDRVYGAYQSRLDPMWAARDQGQNAMLANQGLAPGSDAYNNAQRAYGQQRNDSYNQAIGQSVGLGQQEQAQARANAMLPLQQASGMLGMLGAGGVGNLGNPARHDLAAQQMYSAARDQQEASNAKKGSTMGGLGSIAGTVFGGPLGGMAGGAVGNMLGGSNPYASVFDPARDAANLGG